MSHSNDLSNTAPASPTVAKEPHLHLFLIETVTTYRNRIVVAAANKKEAEAMLDNDQIENDFTQEFLKEHIVKTVPVNLETLREMNKVENGAEEGVTVEEVINGNYKPKAKPTGSSQVPQKQQPKVEPLDVKKEQVSVQEVVDAQEALASPSNIAEEVVVVLDVVEAKQEMAPMIAVAKEVEVPLTINNIAMQNKEKSSIVEDEMERIPAHVSHEAKPKSNKKKQGKNSFEDRDNLKDMDAAIERSMSAPKKTKEAVISVKKKKVLV